MIDSWFVAHNFTFSSHLASHGWMDGWLDNEVKSHRFNRYHPHLLFTKPFLCVNDSSSGFGMWPEGGKVDMVL